MGLDLTNGVEVTFECGLKPENLIMKIFTLVHKYVSKQALAKVGHHKSFLPRNILNKPALIRWEMFSLIIHHRVTGVVFPLHYGS